MTLPILILPCWLYHATEGGKIFRTLEALDEAKAQGWRDSPGAAAAAKVEAVKAAPAPAPAAIKTPIVEASKVVAVKQKK